MKILLAGLYLVISPLICIQNTTILSYRFSGYKDVSTNKIHKGYWTFNFNMTDQTLRFTGSNGENWEAKIITSGDSLGNAATITEYILDNNKYESAITIICPSSTSLFLIERTKNSEGDYNSRQFNNLIN